MFIPTISIIIFLGIVLPYAYRFGYEKGHEKGLIEGYNKGLYAEEDRINREKANLNIID